MRSAQQALPVQTMDVLTVDELKKAWSRSEHVEFCDPTLAHTEFHLRETFYPLGFPVTISTNCEGVLDAAAESWSTFHKLFDTEPIRLHFGVTDGGSLRSPTPVYRMRQHLACNISDGENFAISDLRQSYSLVWVTSATLDNRSDFRYFFLESTVMNHIANRFASGIHAACVALDGSGILLCGDSGAGKSTLSYACARAGWTYITDDGSFLVNGRNDRLVVGNCSQIRFRPASQRFFPELRGRAVMQRAEIGKPSIELAMDSNTRLNASFTAQIRHIVFLNRSSGKQELMQFPVEVARLFMHQHLSSLPELRSLQRGGIDHLLEVGAFELCYTDLDWAVGMLGRLAHEGK